MEKYISSILVVFLIRLLRNSQNQMNSYSTSISTYFQLPVWLLTGNEVKKVTKMTLFCHKTMSIVFRTICINDEVNFLHPVEPEVALKWVFSTIQTYNHTQFCFFGYFITFPGDSRNRKLFKSCQSN